MTSDDNYKALQVDEEGYLMSQGIRLTDESLSGSMLSTVSLDDRRVYKIQSETTEAVLEPFDYPYVAQQVFKEQNAWSVQFPYQIKRPLDISRLWADKKDRFVGLLPNGAPFVMSRKAQMEFFRLVDDYTDEGVIVDGQNYKIPELYTDNADTERAAFWKNIYQETNSPPWDLGQPHPALQDILARLKLNKLRVLVLGAGRSHDADFFAKQGHKVTAVDISEESIEQASDLYGKNPNLEFVHADIFDLDSSFTNAFDLVFEYTCYCAINPQRRKDLVKIWKKTLVEGGNLLGIFWAFFKPQGPPFGSTEWEIRENLKGAFDFLIWERLKKSPESRQGIELLVYGQKKEKF